MKKVNQIDYLELLRDNRFEFYGLFTYSKLDFQNETIFDEMFFIPFLTQISSTQDNEDVEITQYPYKEEDYTWDSTSPFSVDRYPRSFDQQNIVELSELDIKNKISICRSFMKDHSITTVRSSYFYLLAVRCLLHQPIDADQCLQIMVKRLYPWIVFEAYKVKGKKQELVLLYFNFLENFLYETNYTTKIQQKSPFAQIDRITYGFQSDEIIVSFDKQMIVFKARYVFQRAFIAEVFRFAQQKDADLRLRAHYINPNNDNFFEEFNKQEQTFKNAQIGFFKLVHNDKILPPKAVLTYKGLLISEIIVGEHINKKILSTKERNITLGINNILVHGYEQEAQFFGLIPINDSQIYVEQTQDSKCFIQIIINQGLGFHVGGAKNYIIFKTELEAINFSKALYAIRKKEIVMDTIYMHMPNRKSQQHLLKFKKHKLKEIQQKFEETKAYLDQINEIKDWLELAVTQGEFNNMTYQQYQKSEIKSPNQRSREKSSMQTNQIRMINKQKNFNSTSQNSSEMISSKHQDNSDMNILKQFQ